VTGDEWRVTSEGAIGIPGVEPYFRSADGRQVLYHGDCQELLPKLPSASIDLVLVDPPYKRMKGNVAGVRRDATRKTPHYSTLGDVWEGGLEWLSEAWRCASSGMIVFCSHHFICDVPILVGADPMALLTWCKPNTLPPLRNVPFWSTEFLWAFKRGTGMSWRELKTYLIANQATSGVAATERVVDGNHKAVHPTQKPLALIDQLLVVKPETVLDPCSGTGTTMVACARKAMACVGMEIEERYCEVAAKRLEQQTLPFHALADDNGHSPLDTRHPTLDLEEAA